MKPIGMKTMRGKTNKLMILACSVVMQLHPGHVQAASCDSNARMSTPTSDFRFLDGGAVVYHRRTGLEWRRCPEGMAFVRGDAPDHSRDICRGAAEAFSLQGAKDDVVHANTGAGRNGHRDWRLPSVEELSSIVEQACTVPSINEAVFPDTPVTWFWADPPVRMRGGEGTVWGVGFGAGGYYVGLDNGGAVRLVRSHAGAADTGKPGRGFEISLEESTQGNFGVLGVGVGYLGGGAYLDEKGVRRSGLHANLSITIEGKPSQFRQPQAREGQTLKVDGYRILVEKILPENPRGIVILRVWSP